MITAYLLIQQAAAALGIPVVADGIPGPQTEHCARVMANTVKYRASLPKSGAGGSRRPLGGGRASTFGGSTDPGDYYEGLGYTIIADPDGSGPLPARYTPAEYFARDDVAQFRPYFVPEMATTDTWSVKGIGKIGVSYFLKPGPAEVECVGSVYYAAARLYGPLHALAKAGTPIYLEVTNTAIIADGKPLSIIVRVLDWGPTETWTKRLVKMWNAKNPNDLKAVGDKWRFDIDLSPAAYAALRLVGKWDSRKQRWLDAVDWEVL